MAIRNTLLTSLMVKPDRVDDVVSTYDELFRHVTRNILTTNYDNVLETYCEQKKIGLVNGFGKSHLGDRRTWGGDKRAQGGAWRGGKDALRLIKLHGSITWQKDDGGVLEIGRPGMALGVEMEVIWAGGNWGLRMARRRSLQAPITLQSSALTTFK